LWQPFQYLYHVGVVATVDVVTIRWWMVWIHVAKSTVFATFEIVMIVSAAGFCVAVILFQVVANDQNLDRNQILDKILHKFQQECQQEHPPKNLFLNLQ
jgi:hypothetical protein